MYQSSRAFADRNLRASNPASTKVKSQGATLRGLDLSTAKLYDDAARSASFLPRRHSVLTTSLVNVGDSGYDPLVSGSGATINLYPNHGSRLSTDTRANLILSDSRLRYSDICDTHKSSHTSSAEHELSPSGPSTLPHDLTVSNTHMHDMDANTDKYAKETFLTSLDTVTMPSLTEAVLTRPDLTTSHTPQDQTQKLPPINPILTNEPLILPVYAKKTDFSPPFTMMPRSPILKMIIDRNRTKSLLDRGLLPAYGDLDEEELKLIAEPDDEQQFASPHASEFIRMAYKTGKNMKQGQRHPSTREQQDWTDNRDDTTVRLYQNSSNFLGTHLTALLKRQQRADILQLRRFQLDGTLTPSTRDKDYIKMATLQPPASHYRHTHQPEPLSSSLTFEQMLRYVPETNIEYSIFNVYRWRPTWYDLKGWGDPHAPPTISDLRPSDTIANANANANIATS